MERDTKNLIKSLGYLSTIGLAMALSIGIGALVGVWLDKQFGTRPWLFFIFLALGVAAAFRNLYVMYKRLQKMEDQ